MPTTEQKHLLAEITRVDESMSFSVNPWEELSPKPERPMTMDRPGGEGQRQKATALRPSHQPVQESVASSYDERGSLVVQRLKDSRQ